MKISCNVRDDIGSRKAGRLRAEGTIPAVIYGNNFDNHVISLSEKEVLKALRELGENALVKLDVAGSTETAMVKEIQRHPVKGNVIHIDLQQVSSTERIQVEVPIVLIGREEGGDGVLQQQWDYLNVECLAVDIPRNITIDISDLEVGDSFTVGDIKVEGDFEILDDKEEVIASVTFVQEEVEEEEVEEMDAADVPEISEETAEEEEGSEE